VIFSWDSEKNKKLKERRGVSFEQIILLIERDYLLDIVKHPYQTKHGDQRLYIIDVDNHAHVVPFVDKDDNRILKTIIPSRTYTKKYLRPRGKNNE
jgi:uncharacterized DUF497 family protein